MKERSSEAQLLPTLQVTDRPTDRPPCLLTHNVYPYELTLVISILSTHSQPPINPFSTLSLLLSPPHPQTFTMQNPEPPLHKFRWLAIPGNPRFFSANYEDFFALSSKLMHFIPVKNAKVCVWVHVVTHGLFDSTHLYLALVTFIFSYQPLSRCQYTLILSIHTIYQHTLSTHPINTHTNPPHQSALTTHPTDRCSVLPPLVSFTSRQPSSSRP